MEKGNLFRVRYVGPGVDNNSYRSDVFVFLAEDDGIILGSKISFTSGLPEDWVKSFYKDNWNFSEVGPDIKQFIQERLTRSTTTEAATV